MSNQFEYIAIHHADGKVSRMQIYTRAPASAFDAKAAEDNGFTFDNTTQEWVREATRENVQREIGKTIFPKNIAAPDGWKVINLADMTTVRTDYDQISERKQLRDR